jgi:hypothetical protein
MADPAVLAQLQQLVGQLNALQQTVENLQARNNTLTTRIVTLEAENTTLTAANTTLTAQVQNLSGGAVAGGAAGGGAGAAPLVTFAATPAMVNHQDLINYSAKVRTTIYNEGCKKHTTEFDMKLSRTIIYTTKLQAKCIKMGWHMGIHQIINFTNAAGSTINIVYQYRQIITAMLQAQCEVFYKSTGEPRATTSWYKQAISHQRRKTRRRSKQQGWGHLPLTSIPSSRKTSTSTLPPSTTKPSSCTGITALTTWPFQSSINLHLTARSLDVWPRSSLLHAQDAFLVP